VAGNEHILTKAAIATNMSIDHNMAKMPDAGVFANLARLINHRARMNNWFSHTIHLIISDEYSRLSARFLIGGLRKPAE
jgi:hypothetical protein